MLLKMIDQWSGKFVFCFTNVMFIAKGACNDVNHIVVVKRKCTKSGLGGSSVGVSNEFPISAACAVL